MANARNMEVPQNASQYMNLKLLIKGRAIVLPAISTTSEVISTGYIDMLRSSAFGDRPGECPIEHIGTFLDLCESRVREGVSEEYVRLISFKWSVVGKAKTWLDDLPSRSITTWEQLSDFFF